MLPCCRRRRYPQRKAYPAADQNGATTVTLTLEDGAGGITSRTFTFTVKAINDKPAFTRGANVNVPEDSGAYAAAGWATGITTGAVYLRIKALPLC